jgi:cellulase
VVTAIPTVIAVPTSTSAPAATSTAEPSSSLPESFTLDTFINWLTEVGKSSGKIARRHSRQF